MNKMPNGSHVAGCVVFKERDRQVYIKPKERFQHKYSEWRPVESEKRQNALMSKHLTSVPKIHNIIKAHNYKISIFSCST